MKSGSLWLVVVGFPKANPLGIIEQSREQAVQSIKDLPDLTETEGQVQLFKLSYYKKRLYAKRQVKLT